MAYKLLTAQQLFEKYETKLGDTSDHLWGQHIRTESVTYFVGETSVGKTTFLYNLCLRLSRGEAFLNITPPRPLRILHIDYESSGSNCVEALWNIGHNSPNWILIDLDDAVDNGEGIHGPPMMQFLNSIKPYEYDMLIVDPLMEAYPVSDENNNVEATAQMLAFRKIARTKKMGVVVVHNTGKAFVNPKTKQEQSSTERASRKFLGRGAAARQDKADVGINYVSVDDTTRIARVVKSRTSNLGTQWTLSFDGNHGLAVREVSQVPSAIECQTGPDDTLALGTILDAHAGESLKTVYELHIKDQLNMSRRTFFRKLQLIRAQRVTPVISSE